MGDPNQVVVPPALLAPPLPDEGGPGPINYFRFTAQIAGWTSVASFGTASVWHQARDLLTQQRIVCRMVADPTSTRKDDQRIELLVMASEAEWARDVLQRGIPELAGTAIPPGGYPLIQPGIPLAARDSSVPPPLPEWYFRQHSTISPRADLAELPRAGVRAPLAALPVAPLTLAPSPGQSAAYTTILVLAFVALAVLIIAIIAICFMPGY
jgi:hypothetical protein